jgi:hypothetical protein
MNCYHRTDHEELENVSDVVWGLVKGKQPEEAQKVIKAAVEAV